MVEPIKPSDLKFNNIPDFVIEVVNKLIVKKWNGMESRIYTKDIISVIETNYNISQDKIYLNHWLDNNMDAPDNIYLFRNPIGVIIGSWFLDSSEQLDLSEQFENIEYIRKDALIEELAEFLDKDYLIKTKCPPRWVPVRKVVEDFKNYIK